MNLISALNKSLLMCIKIVHNDRVFKTWFGN